MLFNLFCSGPNHMLFYCGHAGHWKTPHSTQLRGWLMSSTVLWDALYADTVLRCWRHGIDLDQFISNRLFLPTARPASSPLGSPRCPSYCAALRERSCAARRCPEQDPFVSRSRPRRGDSRTARPKPDQVCWRAASGALVACAKHTTAHGPRPVSRCRPLPSLGRPAAEARPDPVSAPVPPSCPPPDLRGHPSIQNRAPPPRPRVPPCRRRRRRPGRGAAPERQRLREGRARARAAGGKGKRGPLRAPALPRFQPPPSASRPPGRRGRPWGTRGGASPPPPLPSLRPAAPDGKRRRSVPPRCLVSAGPGGRGSGRPASPLLPGALQPLPPPRRSLSPAVPGPAGRGRRRGVEGRPSGQSWGGCGPGRSAGIGGQAAQARPGRPGGGTGDPAASRRPRLPGRGGWRGALERLGAAGGRRLSESGPAGGSVTPSPSSRPPSPSPRRAARGQGAERLARPRLAEMGSLPRAGFEPAHGGSKSQLLQSWGSRIDLARGEEWEWKRSCAALSSSRQSLFISFPTGTTAALAIGISVVPK